MYFNNCDSGRELLTNRHPFPLVRDPKISGNMERAHCRLIRRDRKHRLGHSSVYTNPVLVDLVMDLAKIKQDGLLISNPVLDKTIDYQIIISLYLIILVLFLNKCCHHNFETYRFTLIYILAVVHFFSAQIIVTKTFNLFLFYYYQIDPFFFLRRSTCLPIKYTLKERRPLK